jgi:hypothetical protein
LEPISTALEIAPTSFALGALEGGVTLVRAWATPELKAFALLRGIVRVGRLEGLAAKIAKLVDALVWGNVHIRIRLKVQRKTARDFLSLARVKKTKLPAMLITLMSVEEHEHALITQVALAESLAIETVDLGVGEDVADAL